MMLSSPLTRSMPNPRWFRAFPRKFFEVSVDAIRSLPPREPKVTIAPWSEARQEDAAPGWYRAYAAYCGISESAERWSALVAQGGARKPV